MRRETQGSSPKRRRETDYKRVWEKEQGQKKWQDQKRREYISTLMEGWERSSFDWVIA